MKKTITLLVFIFCFSLIRAQIPQGYYDSAMGLNGQALKVALHNIIKNHTVIPYYSLNSEFPITDNKGDSIVWDIYSDVPSGAAPYTFSYAVSTDQCGNYSAEGDCFNKEHSWPQSWFNSTSIPTYSDLFHIYPTDGYVNNRRSNYPYGEVSNPSWTAENGGKLGPCTFPGYTSTVFEPIDEFKGDLARSYFYITVRYYSESSSWPGSDMTTGSELKDWAYNLMYKWHTEDPVSQKEIDRNNAIYGIQHNRNPFIDHPEWVDSILHPLGISNVNKKTDNISVYPNPTSNDINISNNYPITDIVLFDAPGKEIIAIHNIAVNNTKLDLSVFGQGYYLLQVQSEKSIYFKKIIKY